MTFRVAGELALVSSGLRVGARVSVTTSFLRIKLIGTVTRVIDGTHFVFDIDSAISPNGSPNGKFESDHPAIGESRVWSISDDVEVLS